MGEIAEGTPKFTSFVIHEVTPEEKKNLTPTNSILKTPTAVFSMVDKNHRSGKRLTFFDSPKKEPLINGDDPEQYVEVAVSPKNFIRVSPETWKAFKAYRKFRDYPNETMKTDYAYSRLSPFHYREIVPGITMRPNMSRPALHAGTDLVDSSISSLSYASPLASQRIRKIERRSVFTSGKRTPQNYWLWLLLLLALGLIFLIYLMCLPLLPSRQDKSFNHTLNDLVFRLETLEHSLAREIRKREAQKLYFEKAQKYFHFFHPPHRRCCPLARFFALSSFVAFEREVEIAERTKKNWEEKMLHVQDQITTFFQNATVALKELRNEMLLKGKVDFNFEAIIRGIVADSLKLYDADKTARADFALESAGGKVLGTRCTQPWPGPIIMSFDPRMAIRPSVSPGECWAFQGEGRLVLELSYPIIVTGCSLEHIPESIHPLGRALSAPKDFTLWGLLTENDPSPHKFGNYTYRIGANSNTVQFFSVKYPTRQLYKIVELQIESNHGFEYTCLYRIRIHGSLE